MADCIRVLGEYFQTHWYVENFQFCWHKTGERLESPLFKMNLPDETFWRLQLYPRGEDDGEYISLYLLREERGPEIVHAHVEFHLHIETVTNPTYFSDIKSFKVHQREGYKCFMSRRELFAMKAVQKDTFVMHFCCLFHYLRNMTSIKDSVQFLRTRILVERFEVTEIFDNDKDLDCYFYKDIDVKPMLEDIPLIKINLLHAEDSLVIKIYPVSCIEMKYAMCKIILFKIGEKESSIKHIRTWMGKVKTDIWRYKVNRLKGTSTKQSPESFCYKSFIFRYDFAFTTGAVEEECLLKDYFTYVKDYEMCKKTRNASFQQIWDKNYQNANSSPTALNVLEDIYTSGTFVDVNAENIYRAHKLILSIRCPTLRFSKKGDKDYISFKAMEERGRFKDLFRFLYTDAVDIPSNFMATTLYGPALFLKIELLKMKCRNALIDSLHCRNAYDIFCFSDRVDDPILKTATKNYILSHYDLVLCAWKEEETSIFHKSELIREVIFLKYKKQ